MFKDSKWSQEIIALQIRQLLSGGNRALGRLRMVQGQVGLCGGLAQRQSV